MTIGDRIKLLRKSLSLNQARFASKIDLKKQTISEYEMGNLNPSENTVFRICHVFGVSREWLVDGIGEMSAKATFEVAEKTFIDLVDVNCSAGGGATNYFTEIIGKISFEKDVLGDSKNKIAINVIGNSMLPTITEGDKIVIDTSITTIKDDKIYVLCTDMGVLIKRLRVCAKGIVLISDNKDYPQEIVKPNDIRIIGKVVAQQRNFD